MLSPRTDKVLKYIVSEYITTATPVPSQRISVECAMGVSPATIRNEMAYLEQEGYLTRPHPSAGTMPTDKGYRHYVDSLKGIKLPVADQRLIGHLFHQVEEKLEEWLSLTAMLVARLNQNVAIVTMAKPADCRFKHMEMVSIQEPLVLVILVLVGARIRQQLITFDQAISQAELTAMANKFNDAFSGLTRTQITTKNKDLAPNEQQITDYMIQMMQDEDKQEYEEPYLDGWHFMLDQPEFVQGQRMRALMELAEQRNLLKAIIPQQPSGHGVQVAIGKENQAEVIHDYSVVIRQYSLPNDAVGTIGILGPTRMHYARAISTVGYLSAVLKELAADLYGTERPDQPA